jgi:hypothetical protein
MNRSLLKEVSVEEVRATLFSMQSGESMGPWMVFKWSFSNYSMTT